MNLFTILHLKVLLGILTIIPIISACSVPNTTPSPAIEPTPTEIAWINQVYVINQKLGRGVNLGNALEGSPNEGDWGVIIQDEYLDLIRDAGFNSVRIPIRWSAHAKREAPFTIDPAFMTRIDEVSNWALERDLAVIINIHHYDEIFLDPDGHEDRFLAIWTQVAEHFQDAPSALVFEILNEPHDVLTPTRWNDLLLKALAVIRETNPNRAVVIGPSGWNGIYELENLQLPQGDQNLIVTVHYYLPFEFTHQGADWAEGSNAWLGTNWKGTPGQRALLRADLSIAAAWGKEHNRPIYLGEFGAYNQADIDSRSTWTDAVARTSEEFGFSWGYWEFCAGFGIYDPLTKTWNEPLVQALIPAE